MRQTRRLTAQERSDPRIADSIIDSAEFSAGAKRLCLKFLAESIGYLSEKHPDRWGTSLFLTGFRLNVGWVACLTLRPGVLNVLVHKKSAPAGMKFHRDSFTTAPGCDTARVPLSEIAQILPLLTNAHQKALSIVARRPTNRSIRNAHSTGITTLLSRVLRRPVPNPSYAIPAKLHLLNGGYGNGDKDLLEQAARGDRHAQSWVVPKTASIGDDVVINVAGYGLFVTGRIASPPGPKTGWRNRYGAGLDSIKLIDPPISLGTVQRHVPDLKWARYPRSICTPSPELADKVRNLVKNRRKTRMPDTDDVAIKMANPDELKKLALLSVPRSATPKRRQVIYRIRSKAIRRYILHRAQGLCEGCSSPSPFRGVDGQPYLEAHHTRRLADGGLDALKHVIALCPNCHCRTERGEDAKFFNSKLIRLLAKLEPDLHKA